MILNIRPEQETDFLIIFQLIKSAFLEMPYSSHTEQFLVEKLRKTDAYIPELALVAEHEDKIVGYIILTKIHIAQGDKQLKALSLGPVAVWPELHHRGIGTQLINRAHEVAHQLGHQRVILLGHKDYYPRFGYERTDKYGIEMPFESAPENCMVLGLTEDALDNAAGKVIYSKPFLE